MEEETEQRGIREVANPNDPYEVHLLSDESIEIRRPSSMAELIIQDPNSAKLLTDALLKYPLTPDQAFNPNYLTTQKTSFTITGYPSGTFKGDLPPEDYCLGTLWYNKLLDVLFVFDGERWSGSDGNGDPVYLDPRKPNIREEDIDPLIALKDKYCEPEEE